MTFPKLVSISCFLIPESSIMDPRRFVCPSVISNSLSFEDLIQLKWKTVKFRGWFNSIAQDYEIERTISWRESERRTFEFLATELVFFFTFIFLALLFFFLLFFLTILLPFYSFVFPLLSHTLNIFSRWNEKLLLILPWFVPKNQQSVE